MIPVPKTLLILLAGGVAVVTAANGALAIEGAAQPQRVAVALGLFLLCFVLSAVDRGPAMSPLLSGLNAGVVLAIALLCTSDVAPVDAPAVSHWYIAAAGCLLVITMLRRRASHAWIGAGLMLAQTLVWAGPAGVVDDGTGTMVLWVAAASFGVRSLSHAMRDIHQFARSEREAVEWQAAQDAHHFERQVRLTQTSRVALPMLRHIAEVDGELDDADRFECRVLEQTIRDEIRGRRLLNDAVREQVIAHRRRGALVQVNDDGGLDDVEPSAMEPLLEQVAEALSSLRSDRIIIRTAPKDSARALSVVAMSSDPVAAALGVDDGDDQVDLWLELDRPVQV